MTPEQRNLARHALGLGRSKTSYRNYYSAHVGSDGHSGFMGLVANGLARIHTSPDGLDAFNLTRAGAEMALDPGESLDPEDFPGA